MGRATIFRTVLLIGLVLFSSSVAYFQTSTFTLQGKLEVSGSPANGNYDMRFRLFDAAENGGQIGSTITVANIPAIAGIFTAQLDFGSAVFGGQDRWVEISVSPAGQNMFVVLTPRQRVTSAPYSIQSSNALTASDSQELGGIPAAQYVLTGDARLSDARIPLPGSNDYVQNNANTSQPGVNFNVGGTGAANILDAATQFNLGGNRILTNAGTNNLFAGIGAGTSNTGAGNSFFGRNAGQANTVGGNNSFFGQIAGAKNTTGSSNAFFGSRAGSENTTGLANSFFGGDAGFANVSGSFNSFFGQGAGRNNTSGSSNSFFGRETGSSNTNGAGNSFFGYQSGVFNTGGGGNAFFGVNSGFNNTQGSQNSFFGSSVASSNTTGSSNAFYGSFVGQNNTTGDNNSFFGRSSGSVNTIGNNNTFIGSFADASGAGFLDFATAIGSHATVSASDTVVIGKQAGTYHGFNRSADAVYIPGKLGIGTITPQTKIHVSGDAEAIRIQGSALGIDSGAYISFATGGNATVGYIGDGSSGNNDMYVTSYVGSVHLYTEAGPALTATSTGNVSMLGGPATPFNSAAQVFDNNNGPFKGLIARSIFMDATIGNGFDSFLASPIHVCARVQTLGTGFGGYALVRCSTSFSSAEEKKDIQPFSGGLNIIRQLNPVSFRWKKGGDDVGLNAEEVAAADPSLVDRNEKGEAEEVRGNSLTAVLINAIKQQQQQIESQQRQIEMLKRIVCRSNPDEEICKP